MSIVKRSTLGKKKQLGFSDELRIIMYTLLLVSTEGTFRNLTARTGERKERMQK